MKKLIILIFLLPLLTWGQQIVKEHAQNPSGDWVPVRVDASGNLIQAGSTNTFTTGFTATASGTVADTLTFGFTSKEFTIRNEGVLTDSLYVSTSASFPVGSTWVYRGGDFETIPVAATVLYVKGGVAYVASRKYIITAN